MKIGFMGLGHMGTQMAERIRLAGYHLTVYNRTAKAAEVFVQNGVEFSPTPSGLSDCDFLISMLSDDQALESVVNGPQGILKCLKPGAIHISMSTISPAMAEKMEKEHQSRNCTFVGAPVFGRPDAAQAGKLFILFGGEEKIL